MFLARSKMICARNLQSLTIIRIKKSNKQSPLPLFVRLPWSYLQSLSLSQVHRQVRQKQNLDE